MREYYSFGGKFWIGVSYFSFIKLSGATILSHCFYVLQISQVYLNNDKQKVTISSKFFIGFVFKKTNFSFHFQFLSVKTKRNKQRCIFRSSIIILFIV